MGVDVGAESGGKGLAEQDVAVLAARPLVHEDLAALQVHVGDLDAAQFRDLDRGEEQQP
jgi:hypothetical protein